MSDLDHYLIRLVEAELDGAPLPEPANDAEVDALRQFEETSSLFSEAFDVPLNADWTDGVWSRIDATPPLEAQPQGRVIDARDRFRARSTLFGVLSVAAAALLIFAFLPNARQDNAPSAPTQATQPAPTQVALSHDLDIAPELEDADPRAWAKDDLSRSAAPRRRRETSAKKRDKGRDGGGLATHDELERATGGEARDLNNEGEASGDGDFAGSEHIGGADVNGLGKSGRTHATRAGSPEFAQQGFDFKALDPEAPLEPPLEPPSADPGAAPEVVANTAPPPKTPKPRPDDVAEAATIALAASAPLQLRTQRYHLEQVEISALAEGTPEEKNGEARYRASLGLRLVLDHLDSRRAVGRVELQKSGRRQGVSRPFDVEIVNGRLALVFDASPERYQLDLTLCPRADSPRCGDEGKDSAAGWLSGSVEVSTGGDIKVIEVRSRP